MKRNRKNNSDIAWPFIVLVLAFVLSVAFGVASEFALNKANVFIAAIIIVIFIVIAIIADMVGVAIASAQPEPFHAMASRNVRGAKHALKLLSNAPKVASVSADVIGDVCGILSGAAAASISLMLQTSSVFYNVLISVGFSALVASITIFGKALFKKRAINKAESIILALGKIISVFAPEKKRGKKAKEQVEKENDKSEKNC